MAVTRRIIWVNDSEWSVLAKIAEDTGRTISVVVRDLAIDAYSKSATVQRIADALTPMTADLSAQQERDAILKRVNRKTGE